AIWSRDLKGGLALTRSSNSDEGNAGIAEVRKRRVNGDDLLDICARAWGCNDAHRRKAALPDFCIELVVAVRYDKERRLAEFLKGSHLIFVKRDRIENDEPAIAQPYHGHAPCDVSERHWDFTDNGEDVLFD